MDIEALLDYHPDGYFIWKESRGRVKAGQRAGNRGVEYDQIKVDGKCFSVHRLVFLYHHGYLPAMVDHINGDKRDNRIENLRECSPAQNSQNRKKRVDNTSGETGVRWNGSRWVVSVTADSRIHYGGKYTNRDDAVAKARQLREQHHGEFQCIH